FKAMGVAAKGVGKYDLVEEQSFLDSLGLPTVPVGTTRMVDVGGHKLGVVTAEDSQELISGTNALENAGAEFVVGLVHASLEKTQLMGDMREVRANLLVSTHPGGELGGEDNRLVRTAVPVVQLQSKGRSLLRADLTFGDGTSPFELIKGQAEQDKELAALDERIELLRAQVNEPSLQAETLKVRKAKLEELLKRRETLASVRPTVPAGKNAFTLRFIPLETTVPDEPAVASLVSTYDKDVGQLNLAFAKAHGETCPAPAKGQAGYVGSKICRDCHEESFPSWEQSKHASAYKTLESKNKQFHLDCVGCHVTGWQKPGGVCRIDQVADRTDVGCESCHGPGSIHVDDPSDSNIKLGNDEQTCIGCHDPENSPHFSFSAYLPKILGKGHEAHAKR
ncbi:MAG: multiheme c-type cytochrome, partial [Myxococcaceae bacterium]